MLQPSEEQKIELQLPALDTNSEYHINILVHTAVEQPMIPKGHLVAREQFLIQKAKPFSFEMKEGHTLSMNQDNDKIEVQGDNFTIVFSKKTGHLDTYKFKGVSLLSNTLKANFWRPPNDNDLGNRMPERLAVWKKASTNQQLTTFNVFDGIKKELIKLKTFKSGGFQIHTTYTLEDIEGKVSLIYSINEKGAIKVETTLSNINTELPELPRFGNTLEISSEFNQVKWYGRGPYENYWDRKAASFVGNYSASVDALYEAYLRPQENGNRTDIRQVSFKNEAGHGITIYSQGKLNFSAHHQHINDFDQELGTKRKHISDIEKKPFVEIKLDYEQMGVGGLDSWGAKPLPKYTLQAKEYSFSYVIKPEL